MVASAPGVTLRTVTADRLERARAAAAAAGVDVVLVTPGPDLRYLTGYEAMPLERLTCLVLPADGDPVLVVPALERPAAQASPAGSLGVEIVDWQETEDPIAQVTRRFVRAQRVGLDGGDDARADVGERT